MVYILPKLSANSGLLPPMPRNNIKGLSNLEVKIIYFFIFSNLKAITTTYKWVDQAYIYEFGFYLCRISSYFKLNCMAAFLHYFAIQIE